MSKIQEAAKAAFANHPGTDEVYVTEDGNAFLPEVKNLALDHARRSNLPAPVLVKRDEVKEEKEVKEAVPTEPKEAEEAEPDYVEEAAPEEAEEAAPEEEVAKPKAKKKGK